MEIEPGRFEIRQVVLGPSCGEQIVILSGVEKGEHVATRGNFLIDSQMQLAGNPSLIDPTKAEPTMSETMSEEMIAALSGLSPEDRALAERQRICPVTEMPLGSMGAPPKVDVNGQTIFICCNGCRKSLLADPQKYLDILAKRAVAEREVDDPVPSDTDPLQPQLPEMELPQMDPPPGDPPDEDEDSTNQPPPENAGDGTDTQSSGERELS